MKSVLPILDAAVGSLIEDLDERGLLDSTMVLVHGRVRPHAADEQDRRAGLRSRARAATTGAT